MLIIDRKLEVELEDGDVRVCCNQIIKVLISHVRLVKLAIFLDENFSCYVIVYFSRDYDS